MRNVKTILSALILYSVVSCSEVQKNHTTDVHSATNQAVLLPGTNEVQQAVFFFGTNAVQLAASPPVKTNVLYIAPKGYYDPNRPVFSEESYSDRLMGMVNADLLKKYEGQYTWSDLQNQESGSSSFSLKSKWLIGSSNAPQVGIKAEKIQESEMYKVSGGEVFLPQSGVGVSYEKDSETGESKTFLNIKKEF